MLFRARRESFSVEEGEVLEVLEAITIGGYGARCEVFIERKPGRWRRTDEFSVLVFLLGPFVEEEGDRKGEEQENENYNGGYYASIEVGAGIWCCVFEAKCRRG